MTQFLSRKAQSIEPYVAGEQPMTQDLIKLNTNENPYPPSPRVAEAVASQVGFLRLYPEIDCETLRKIIAAREGLSPNQVFLGNGSDEVLSLSFPAFFNPDEPVRFPSVTYSFYKVYAELFGIPYQAVPMKPGFAVDVDALTEGSGGVILANPNAPTTIQLPLDAIEKLAQRQLEKGKVLLVDEAYVSFGDQPSAATLVNQYPNLVVTRTMSKDHSLAGLRVGYALAQHPLIEGLCNVKDSFNSYPVDRLAIAGAAASLRDEEYFQTHLEMVKKTRQTFTEELRARGFETPDSSANFVFTKPCGIEGKKLFDELRKRNILVRRWNDPQISEWLRITIGTDEQMAKVIRAIDEIIRKNV